MQNKKFSMILLMFIIIVILSIIGLYLAKQISIETTLTDYIPEPEIAETQAIYTTIKLYFYNTETNSLSYELKEIDSKELLTNPEITLLNFLFQGPTKENLQNLIPTDTKILSSELKNGVLILNLSNNFINNTLTPDIANMLIYSIVNTMCELTEITSVKFLVEGNENAKFKDCDFSLENNFSKKY